ncbi:MAG: hypothetical protein HY586_03020 [Candidatus Omnitrophica bacterium]|nr:hypothetical protein [Candidatus Omnitrophota bacterium]
MKYSVNPGNRLVVELPSGLSTRSVLLPGYFELSPAQTLRYQMIEIPGVLKENGWVSPNQTLEFSGTWRLDKQHRLVFQLEETGEELVLGAGFVSKEAYKLVFSVTTRRSGGASTTRLFKFQGHWQTDAQNRIAFALSYRDSFRGRLVFEGRWKALTNHEIVYRYLEEQLKRGRKRLQTLRFQGVWQIAEQGFLEYRVEGRSDSVFRFRAEFLRMESSGKNSQILFRIGIEVANQLRRQFQTIRLVGSWRVRGPLEIGFETKYASGRVEEIRLSAGYKWTGRGKIDVELFRKDGEPLGIQGTMMTKLLGGKADLFLHARASEREQAVESGIQMKW